LASSAVSRSAVSANLGSSPPEVLADRSATRVAVSRERLPVLKAALGLE